MVGGLSVVAVEQTGILPGVLIRLLAIRPTDRFALFFSEAAVAFQPVQLAVDQSKDHPADFLVRAAFYPFA